MLLRVRRDTGVWDLSSFLLVVVVVAVVGCCSCCVSGSGEFMMRCESFCSFDAAAAAFACLFICLFG